MDDSARRAHLISVLQAKGHRRLDEPVQLASGDMSRHFIDCKRALAHGDDLRLAAEAMAALADEMGAAYDAVGGLTMGADPFAHAIAVVAGVEWFAVRKAAKGRGTNQRVEGAVLGPGRAVLLVDDVVTRAGSIIDALGAVRETGAAVTAAVCLVDRGTHGVEMFEKEDVPYRPLFTYQDIGIPAVGTEWTADEMRGFMAEWMPFCVTIGVDPVSARADEVRMRLPWAPERCTAAGILHGGALMALADGAGAWCAFLNLPEGALTTTIESKTNFLRAAKSDVEAVSTPLHVGRTIVVVDTSINDDQGRLVARVTQTQAVLAPR